MRALGDRRGDAFEMRPQAAQLGSEEGVDKSELPVQPRIELVLNLVMNGQRDLGAVAPHFREIDKPHQFDISAPGLKGELIGRVVLDRCDNGVRVKAKRPTETEVDCF